MQKNRNYSTSEQSKFLQMISDIGNTPLVISIVGGGGKTHLAFWLAKQFKHSGHAVCVTTSTRMYMPSVKDVGSIQPLSEFEWPDNNHLNGTTTFIYKSLIETKDESTPDKVSGLEQAELSLLNQKAKFDVIIIEADGAKQKPIKAPEGHEPCIFDGSDWVIAVTGAEAILSKAEPDMIHRWSRFSAITHCLPETEIGYCVLHRLITHPEGMFKQAPEHTKRIWVINKLDLSPDREALEKTASELFSNIDELDSVWLTQFNASDPLKQVIYREK